MLLAVDLRRDAEYAELCEETRALALAAGLEVPAVLKAKRDTPDRRHFIGAGKLAELKELMRQERAGTLVLSHAVTDGQHMRLSRELDCEVFDYPGLILTIFARRAKTAAGKLQVELAQEVYGRAKLRGAWTHLERQRGGLGATGGPGERQIELDRRMIARRIKQLRSKLKKHHTHAKLVASKRQRRLPTLALVGYTNAGKSTLFRALTSSKVPASARLFETLDTTTRQLHLGEGRSAALSDTVGFVRNLPHELIDAFRSTLNEAVEADLLLLVLDGSDASAPAKLRTIQETLRTIGAGELPQLLLLNKIDQGRSPTLLERLRWDKIAFRNISAATGEGLPELRRHIAELFPAAGPPAR